MRRGWVITEEVTGPDVDEFATGARVVEALAVSGAADDTLLAVQHPHRTPDALARGLSVTEALPSAVSMLDRLRRRSYREVIDVVAPYRVDGPDGVAVGVLCMVDPAAVDAQGVARVRHSEQVYPEVVADRAAVLSGLRCATSAAMLVPVDGKATLTAAVTAVMDTVAEPAVSSTDSAGRCHRLWLLGPGPAQADLLALVHRYPLLVADGNHRLAAAAASDTAGLLALVTGGPDLRVGPIDRELVGTGLRVADLAAAWRRMGLRVDRAHRPGPPDRSGFVVAEAVDGALIVELPGPDPDEPRPTVDHGVVERLLIAEALGIDPAGPRVRALTARRTPSSDCDVVLRLASVPFADVLAVHAQGRRMPRKSTYFTPKPRSGLLLADLTP